MVEVKTVKICTCFEARLNHIIETELASGYKLLTSNLNYNPHDDLITGVLIFHLEEAR